MSLTTVLIQSHATGYLDILIDKREQYMSCHAGRTFIVIYAETFVFLHVQLLFCLINIAY